MSDSITVPKDLLSVGQTARMLGCSIQSVRNYCEAGELQAFRIGGGAHRRISRTSIVNYLHGGCLDSPSGKVLCYARTSSASQKEDLRRQIDRLKEYVKGHYPGMELVIYSDNASSMNWNRPGLNKLLVEVMSGSHKGSTLLITSQCRLGRHCRQLLELLFSHFEVNILYTEQDDDASVEELLTSELLAIVHLYSIRMYGKKSAERRRVRPTSDALKRGIELRELGQTEKFILKTLREEGFKCENGKEITLPAVKTYIVGPSVKLETLNSRQTNSADEFKEKMIVRASPDTRLRITDLYDYYVMWCRDGNKLPVHRIKFATLFKECGVGWHNRERCWMGLEIRGAKLHVRINAHRTKHTPETPQLRFERFLKNLGRCRIPIETIRENYAQFCKNENIGMATNNEIFEWLKSPLVKRTRTGNRYFYTLGADARNT